MSVESLNLTKSHQDPFPFDRGDVALSLFSAILLWICVPGCALVYSGSGKRKGALTALILSLWVSAIVSLQWWAFGYSLTFSETGGTIVGNFDKVFLKGVYARPGHTPAGSVPEMAFCLYQGVTATFAPSIIFGVTADRGRLLPCLVFTLVWTTFVYDFVAYWTLNPNGWGVLIGVLDFGGGAPVHVPVGAAAMAYSLILGPRKEKTEKPHNMSNVFLGTTLLWIGSFGYNAGSAYRSNMVAVMSCVNTNMSGSASALVWALMDYLLQKKFCAFGFCLGSLVGLVSIVPASGFVSVSSSVAIGALSSFACYVAFFFKNHFFFDDVLDVFVVNAIGGIMGNLLTGVFTQTSYGGDKAGLGGWLDGNWIQVLYQLANTSATFGYSFVVSVVTLFLMNKTPWLQLGVSESHEEAGIDETEVGIKCYEFLDEINPVQPLGETLPKLGPKMNAITNGIMPSMDRLESRDCVNGIQNNSIRHNWSVL